MTTFFNKIKEKTILDLFLDLFKLFLPIFPILETKNGPKTFFPKTPALSRTPLYGFLTPCKTSGQSDGRIDCNRRTNRRKTDTAYFKGPYQLPPGVQ